VNEYGLHAMSGSRRSSAARFPQAGHHGHPLAPQRCLAATTRACTSTIILLAGLFACGWTPADTGSHATASKLAGNYLLSGLSMYASASRCSHESHLCIGMSL